ncbi:MAG: hypothetical protein IT366_10870 [Candidatus Hydrogenedentes bacterium]|nr:hypothetical protein [Candidatus Hydrogenedentota bacterium]
MKTDTEYECRFDLSADAPIYVRLADEKTLRFENLFDFLNWSVDAAFDVIKQSRQN